MAKKKTHLESLRAMVKKMNGGQIPEDLTGVLQECAMSMEIRDEMWETIRKDGMMITEQGSMGQVTRKQHPLINPLYQRDQLIQGYLKELGMGKRKAAIKTEAEQAPDEDEARLRDVMTI